MLGKLKETCRNIEKYSHYIKETTSRGTTVIPAANAERESICPFDNADMMVYAYLMIGYMADRGMSTESAVLDFVNSYGMPRKNTRRLSVSDFSEEAQALYLHFAENASAPYSTETEWVLETEPVSALIKATEVGPVTEWQTPDLYTSIELAYTLMLCGKERMLGVCKHCGAPFAVKNPKAEFCSPGCRNRYNVYKSREKHKNT